MSLATAGLCSGGGVTSYRASKMPPSAGELAEMRAAFGEGATVVDVLTGEKIFL